MSATQQGWVVFLAGLGMMAGLLAVDVTQLHEWTQATTPAFVGTALGHVAATITAFVGGRLIPVNAIDGGRRSTDPQP